jgi:hypothetical protein
MAEFSKQFCELHLQDLPGDFDILELAKDMPVDHFLPCICEGYGFIAVGKDESGEIVLAFRGEEDKIDWKPYQEVIV